MDRLDLFTTRSSQRFWMPLSAILTVPIHWYQRSWPCGGEGCRLCDLVPTREVCYFAALAKTGQGQSHPYLVERSSEVCAEAIRLAKIDWMDGLGKLIVSEEPRGQRVAVRSTSMLEEPKRPPVAVAIVAWSVARLYRMPSFPECSTPGEAVRAIQAFSRRQQALMLASAVPVDQL